MDQDQVVQDPAAGQPEQPAEKPRVSVASKVVIPVEFVALTGLRTEDDKPVVVGCLRVSEVRLARILKKLPGERVKTMQEKEAEQAAEAATGDAADEQKLDRADQVMDVSPEIIELGTFLLDADGNEVRPAFYWGSAPPHPDSIHGRYLSDVDKTALVHAILRIGGYLPGGQADDGGFPGGGGARGKRLGTVAPGTRKRKNAARGNH